jgi:hypothetical protein
MLPDGHQCARIALYPRGSEAGRAHEPAGQIRISVIGSYDASRTLLQERDQQLRALTPPTDIT